MSSYSEIHVCCTEWIRSFKGDTSIIFSSVFVLCCVMLKEFACGVQAEDGLAHSFLSAHVCFLHPAPRFGNVWHWQNSSFQLCERDMPQMYSCLLGLVVPRRPVPMLVTRNSQTFAIPLSFWHFVACCWFCLQSPLIPSALHWRQMLLEWGIAALTGWAPQHSHDPCIYPLASGLPQQCPGPLCLFPWICENWLHIFIQVATDLCCRTSKCTSAECQGKKREQS